MKFKRIGIIMENSKFKEVPQDLISEYFVGKVNAHVLLSDEEVFQCTIYNVTFEKEARTNWHQHPSGQIVIVTNGEGSYQLKGEAVQIMKKGDVITFYPNVEHWHGATTYSNMTHIAINPNTEKGLVEWLKKVTDEEFQNLK